MKNERWNINARTSKKALDYLKANYKTAHAGAVTAIEIWPILRQGVLGNAERSIFGIMSYDDVLFIIRAHRGNKIRPADLASRRNLEAMLADTFDYGEYVEDFPRLIESLRGLELLELIVLREMLVQHIESTADDDAICTLVSGGVV